jgi:hypothetical protein
MTHFLVGSDFLGFLKNDIIHIFSDDGTYRQEKLHEYVGGSTLFISDEIWFDRFDEWKTTFRHPDEKFSHIFDMTATNPKNWLEKY